MLVGVTSPEPPGRPRLAASLPDASPPDGGLPEVEGSVRECRLAGWDAAGGGFDLVELLGVHVDGGSLANSAWRRPVWADVELVDADLANAVLTDARWTRVALGRCRATGADLAAAVVTDATLTDCALDLTNLRFAALTRVVFSGCRLGGADFAGARLTDVWFDRCDLTGATFTQATTTRVRFTASRLEDVRGVASLRGSTIEPRDLLDLASLLADAMGIEVDWQDA